jgi:hypothetical protein
VLRRSIPSLIYSDDQCVTVGATSLYSPPLLAVFPQPNGVVLASASWCGLASTTNNGLTWNQSMFTNGVVSAMIRSADGALIAAVERGWGCLDVVDTSWGIYRSANNGLSWTKLGVVRENTFSLALHPSGSMFAVTDTGIYRSSNGGSLWQRIPLDQGGMHSFAVSSDGWLFAATDNGFYRSSNEGNAWLQLSTSSVTWIGTVIAGKNGEIVLRGSDQGSLIRSTDKGNSWLAMNNGVQTEWLQSLNVDQDGVYMCTGEHGGYVWNEPNGKWLHLPSDGLTQEYLNGLSRAPSGYLFAWNYEGLYCSDMPLTHIAQEIHETPGEFRLEQNYPNPFNPTTAVSYQLSAASKTKLVVYDMLGREVEVLVNELKDPGRYEATWNAAGCASGVFICRMTAGAFTASRKLVLLK